MTKYEILYIIRPNIDEEAKTALVERFDSILKDNGAATVESKDWEKRRLAYEIGDFRVSLMLKLLQMRKQSMNLIVWQKSMMTFYVT